MATIHVISGKTNLDCSPFDAKVHYLPCKINADDYNAPVKTYFENLTKADENKVLLNSFRGYPLNGKVINVPDGYKGIVLHENMRPHTEKEERKFYVTNNFKQITYWNWNKAPSKNDVFNQALDWLDIAEVLHAPITS